MINYNKTLNLILDNIKNKGIWLTLVHIWEKYRRRNQ